MSLDSPQNLQTIIDCIGLLNQEINENRCSRAGIEVFFKLTQLQLSPKPEETTHKQVS